MSYIQPTRLEISLGRLSERLERWAINPWRRVSLLLIALLFAFLLGSSIAAVSGVLALMDPIAALLTISIWEVMVRIRRSWPRSTPITIPRQLLDMVRIGLLYGLLLEGFKQF
ncbi:hypothetical protein OMCYN_00488 [cyanobiont of Ornithocercus magnificus]|nr:hypothetical protein OMCYN_00488 [cyanobiont of Ornithocercus magnificus]